VRVLGMWKRYNYLDTERLVSVVQPLTPLHTVLGASHIAPIVRGQLDHPVGHISVLVDGMRMYCP
jgi:hypothetical protein